MEATGRLPRMPTTDRIEKTILLRAPIGRVWRALADAEEFGRWFRVKFDEPFAEGKTVRGRITYPGYEHVRMEILVERMERERLFAFRWHPYAVDPDVDYSAEPTTLVEFRLAAEAGGTRLTITESGFDRIPASRRDEAFRMNGGGWAEQIGNIERHVAAA
jgi:uncharacterized protein YndB with AHSA1/START domain